MTIDFTSKTFLTEQMSNIVSFYDEKCINESGGFFQNYDLKGNVVKPDSIHLVSSTRMTINFIWASQLDASERFKKTWNHGLQFLRSTHWDNEQQLYKWTRNNNKWDETQYAYGLAFVLLTYSFALQAGDDSAQADIYHTWQLLEKRFWLDDKQIYADEIVPQTNTVTTYRGQNANMHLCEALIEAYHATKDDQFIERALLLAQRITQDLADPETGLIWEHYTESLEVDWDFNKDDPQNLYRPWGYQPGHQTEWTKLLVMLYEIKPENWLIERAKALFNWSIEKAWDKDHGGLYYGIAPERKVCDSDKYFWVQAESFAAAALLYKHTKNSDYKNTYNRLWSYCWEHFIDHERGGWYRVLNEANENKSELKSEAGAKCDYHTLGAIRLSVGCF